MQELICQVEFLSDIVLPSSSNTQGNIGQLNFIPGSNFLGMVASNYDNFNNKFSIFHNGDVKFGDATILKDDKQTYKMPLSYFYKKTDDNQIIYNHHSLSKEDFKSFGQLKQKRDGYITSEFKFKKYKDIVNIDYNYSQKSAYDKENRRSLDGNMFGYSAIKSGTKWQFKISYENLKLEDEKLLKSSILGIKRLGKSKSAQYGLVKITHEGIVEDVEDKNLEDIVLYANSRLSLIDECGNPTYDLKYLFNGLKDENIDYQRCKIKISTFTPYNSKRETKDYERVCIDKGSVIVLNGINIGDIPKFVGAYQNEGFGELLTNPIFLMQNKFVFKILNENKDEEKVAIKSDLAKFLNKREVDKKARLDILDHVDKFIKNNPSLTNKKMNSQWGQVRSICSNSNDENIYQDIKKYITHGVAKTKWEGKNERTILEGIKNCNKPLEFTKLASILIPKQKESKDV